MQIQSLSLENKVEWDTATHSMSRGAWQAAVYAVTESQTQLSTHTHK